MQLVVIIGNLGRDPEMRYTANGQAVTEFSVAVSERAGERELTEWFTVVAWDKLAEACAEHLQKGRQVCVRGKMRTRSWDDATTGAKRYKTDLIANEVQFLGSPPRDGAGDREPRSGGGGGQRTAAAAATAAAEPDPLSF